MLSRTLLQAEFEDFLRAERKRWRPSSQSFATLAQANAHANKRIRFKTPAYVLVHENQEEVHEDQEEVHEDQEEGEK